MLRFEWPEKSPGPTNVEIVDYHATICAAQETRRPQLASGGLVSAAIAVAGRVRRAGDRVHSARLWRVLGAYLSRSSIRAALGARARLSRADTCSTCPITRRIFPPMIFFTCSSV
jgi:hypothetical protein